MFTDDIQPEKDLGCTDGVDPISNVAANGGAIDGDVVAVDDRHTILTIRNRARAGRIESDDASADADVDRILDDDAASGKAVDDHAGYAAIDCSSKVDATA